MPTNVYGYNDNFDKVNGHVIPAMITKFVEAKKKSLPSYEKLNNFFIALSNHENIGFPNGVIRMKIPNNN